MTPAASPVVSREAGVVVVSERPLQRPGNAESQINKSAESLALSNLLAPHQPTIQRHVTTQKSLTAQLFAQRVRQLSYLPDGSWARVGAAGKSRGCT